MVQNNPRFWRAVRLVKRGLCLRCPRCGARTLFRNWLAMHERCAVCDLRFEREQGYFLGAMYVNYAFTVAIVLSGYFALEWWTDMPLAYHLVLWGSVSVLCPLILFRYSRGVWLSLDYIFNPADDKSPENHMEWDGEHT
jgi:uncharacterized protein (DUF983 family)